MIERKFYHSGGTFVVCKNCKTKPLVRGIEIIECLKCGKQSYIMWGDYHICKECSDTYGVCKRCGEKIKRKN
jgi:uncharacterized membrane protein